MPRHVLVQDLFGPLEEHWGFSFEIAVLASFVLGALAVAVLKVVAAAYLALATTLWPLSATVLVGLPPAGPSLPRCSSRSSRRYKVQVEGMLGFCEPSASDALLTASAAGPSRARTSLGGLGAEARVQRALAALEAPDGVKFFRQARGHLSGWLLNLTAFDVLSLRETWIDADTLMLLRMDPDPAVWAPGLQSVNLSELCLRQGNAWNRRGQLWCEERCATRSGCPSVSKGPSLNDFVFNFGRCCRLPAGTVAALTDAIRAQLPSTLDLESLIGKRQLAVIGSSSSLEEAARVRPSLAAEIDAHPAVARFNHFYQHLQPDVTGSRTTLHVANAWPEPVEGVPLVDLETVYPLASFCRRMHRSGAARRPFHGEGAAGAPTFALRPSARCGMDHQVIHFTRGFLFYWLLGSLHEQLTLHGFSGGSAHYYGSADVLERYLGFEHFVYDLLGDLDRAASG